MDRGWSWVVLGACFVAFFLCGWFAYTVGVLHSELLAVYQDDVSKTSWVGALHSSMMCLTGPLASFIINRYNCRVCCVLGGIFILLGFSISAFVRGINILMLTYGFIAGIGTGLSYCPAVVSLGYNFKKYLGVTAGLAMTGAALGIFSGGPVIRYFLDKYGLRGAYLLMGAVGANMCVCGMLLRPTKMELEQKEKSKQPGERSAVLKSFSSMCQRYYDICGNQPFLFYNISIFCWNIAQSAIYLHLPFYAESKGTSKEASAALFTGMGVASLAARLLTGLVVTKREVDGVTLHMGTLGMAAICTLLFPLYSATYAGQIIYACMIGLYTASATILLNPLTVELVGLEYLATCFGIETFVLGTGYLVGPPIAGFIVDNGASYDVTFYVAGVFLLVAALSTLGVGAFHGQSELPVDPVLFSSLTIIPPDVVVSNLSLRTVGKLPGGLSTLSINSGKEKAELISDYATLFEVIGSRVSRFADSEDITISCDFQIDKRHCDSENPEQDVAETLSLVVHASTTSPDNVYRPPTPTLQDM